MALAANVYYAPRCAPLGSCCPLCRFDPCQCAPHERGPHAAMQELVAEDLERLLRESGPHSCRIVARWLAHLWAEIRDDASRLALAEKLMQDRRAGENGS